MKLVRWFENKENWANIVTMVLGVTTFALGSLGMLGLDQPKAYIVTIALMIVNGLLQLLLRYWSVDVVASKAEVEAGQLLDPAGGQPK